MKILQINKYYYKKGGAETVFFNTISLLEKEGHIVIPFCLSNKKNEESIYASYFVNFPELSESGFYTKIKNLPSFIYNHNAAKKLEQLIQEEKPDIAHIHLLFNGISISILPILKKYNIPIVMSIHDYRLVCPAYTFVDGQGFFCERCQNKNFYHCILRRCSNKKISNSIMLCLDSYFRRLFISPINYINQFLFVSKFSRSKHIQFEKKFETNSTHLYNFTPAVKEIKTKRGNYILFFGRISEEKGIRTLLSASKQLPEEQFIIIGTGPLFEELQANLPPNVKMLGYKKGAELERYILDASFVVVPSECYENNPMTIIESYTLATPVIGSNLGGIPELINEGKTGFLFTPKSAESLKEVILHATSISDEKYNDISLASKRFASENFSEKTHYERLISIYKNALNKK